MTFEQLYTKFENTNNVCDFYNTYSKNQISTRFLLIRSLDKDNLKDIITMYSKNEPVGHIKDLTKQAYETNVTIEQLLEYIEEKRSQLLVTRQKELEGLSDILSEIPVVNCGVRNDKVDDIVKSFVRNKSIKTYEKLIDELDSSLLQRVRQYCLWSYYNQTANDIIELFFLKHPKVIPTLRKIHDIDFFLKIDDKILPFDLKFTHISDQAREGYFDLISQGIDASHPTFDDYIITKEKDSELNIIRSYYNAYKNSHKKLGLTAASKLTKYDLVSYIAQIGDPVSQDFIVKIENTREKYVPNTSDELKVLEWWNYKYQGERLFCNNNRLFVFVAYKKRFIDGRELKGKTEEIGKKITELLDSLTEESIHEVHYHYDKEDNLVGDYTALSLSTIYSE
ncbi:MAG: hypothetical protein IJE49_13005 [Agathobacter sp.]|nr:hypothetical protein [Agathobacter sp.]